MADDKKQRPDAAQAKGADASDEATLVAALAAELGVKADDVLATNLSRRTIVTRDGRKLTAGAGAA